MTATATTLSADEWISRAETLAPLIGELRDQGEQERRLPQPIFEALTRAELFKMRLPRVYGGIEADDETVIRVIEAISRMDGATGWNFVIGAGAPVFANYLPRPGADEIFGGSQSIVAGGFTPSGKALPVDGGFRVSGRWSFASGCHQANWFMGSSVIMEDGQPRRTAQGAPDIRLMFMPAADGEILDTWYTAGLRGTGSHDIQVNDVFVPETRTFPFFALQQRPTDPMEPRFASSFFNLVVPTLAAVGLGIARDAIDSFKEMAMKKTPLGGTSSLVTYHTVHEKVGRAEALLGSARAYLFEAVRRVSTSPGGNTKSDEETTALVRLASSHAAETAAHVAEMMFTAGGGSAVYATSRLERCFRDASTQTHHAMVQPMNFEMVGQYLLGQGLQMRR